MNYWMRRSRVALPWLVVAVLSAAVVMLAMLPAAWITPQFAKPTSGHVNLVDPAGSLWHGSATLMLAAGSDMSAAQRCCLAGSNGTRRSGRCSPAACA